MLEDRARIYSVQNEVVAITFPLVDEPNETLPLIQDGLNLELNS